MSGTNCAHEPYLGACIHCGIGFREGAAVSGPPPKQLGQKAKAREELLAAAIAVEDDLQDILAGGVPTGSSDELHERLRNAIKAVQS